MKMPIPRSRALLPPAAVLLLALLPGWAGWSGGVADHPSTRAVVVSGHRGAVLAIASDEARGLLFTGGSDGTVKIWDAAARSLVKSLTVTSLQAAMLAVSPQETRFAVLSTDSFHSFSVEVWDWQKGKRLFRIPLDDQPLFLRYSASGRYLLYGLPRWESLRIVNASDGTPVAFHPEGGMVGFATFSKSEKILMTYRMTGVISYWDLASGKLLESLQSVPLLAHIRLSPDLSFLVGSTDSELCLIDVTSGKVRARAAVPGVTSLDMSPSGNEVACIGRDGVLSRWDVGQDSFAPGDDRQAALQQPSVLHYVTGALILGSSSGEIASLAREGTSLSFPGDQRAVITGMAVRGSAVALATSSWIQVFTTGLPDAARQGAGGADSIGSLRVDNPFKAPVDLTFLDDGSMLVWETGDGPGNCSILDLRTETFRPLASGGTLDGPVIQAASDGRKCLLLSKDGTLRIIDIPGGAMRAQTLRPGAMGATLSAGNSVVVGGLPGDADPGSLVRISIDTGETDPVSTVNRYTYDVAYDARTGTLFSLGVDADGTTNLVANSGPDYQTQSVIESSPGEHLSATLCLDRDSGALYSSLGRETISRWSQGSLKALPASARGTVGLFCGAGILYSLNRDSSVSLIDAEHGEGMAELSLFTDGGWALILPDGKFAASEGSQEHVSVLQDGKPVPDPGAYVVPLRVAEGR